MYNLYNPSQMREFMHDVTEKGLRIAASGDVNTNTTAFGIAAQICDHLDIQSQVQQYTLGFTVATRLLSAVFSAGRKVHHV